MHFYLKRKYCLFWKYCFFWKFIITRRFLSLQKDHKLPNTKNRLGDSSPTSSTTSPGADHGDLASLTQGMEQHIGASPTHQGTPMESNLKPEDLSTS